MLFMIVLLHELGHCFAARSVGGSADEILLWPLGGLAYVHHPHNAWASFITTAGGPAVNLVFFLISGAMILLMGFWPPLNPFAGGLGTELHQLGGQAILSSRLPWYIDWTAKFFYLNWFLFCV